MTIAAYQPYEFVETGTPIDKIQPDDITLLFQDALQAANESLKSDGIRVHVRGHIPVWPETESIDCQRNILLSMTEGSNTRPIDIIDVKALDGLSIKPLFSLVEEIVCKVAQHRTAEKTHGIVITSSGCKLDARKLVNHTIDIDAEGFLCIDRKRLVINKEGAFNTIQADKLHSYTISRCIEENESIRLVDEHDLVRPDNVGMLINLTRTVYVHNQPCFLLERDTLTPDQKERLWAHLCDFPLP